MQSRIMELASQREFYIAINTKLHQTLTEHNLTRLPNGVQPVTAGGGASGDTLHPPPQQPQPQALAAICSGPALPHSGGEGNLYEEDPRMQEGGAIESEGSGLLMETDNSDERISVSSTAIPKEAQDSLLHAHFSSMQRTPRGGKRVKSSGGSSNKHTGIQEGLVASDPMLSSVAELPSQRIAGGGGGGGGGGIGGRGYGGGHSRSSHDQLNSNVVMPFHHSGHSNPPHHQHHGDRHTELISSSRQVLENNSRLAAPPNNEGGTPSLNEVTHVTATVQRPIASFGSLPNDTSPMLSSTVGHPPTSDSSNVYYNSPSS